jgi:hypothetical protein
MHGNNGEIQKEPVRSICSAESSNNCFWKICSFLLNQFETYDFDIIYSFDELFAVNHWREIMSTVLQSPRANSGFPSRP